MSSDTRQEARGPEAPEAPSTETLVAQRRTRGNQVVDILLKNSMLIILAVVVIVAQVVYPNFVTFDNLRLLAIQNAQLGILATGVTLVIICGAFDLSIVGTYILSAGVFAIAAGIYGMTWPVAMLLSLIVGVLAGLLNGFVVTILNVNSFIATLGTGAILGGVVQIILPTGGASLEDPQAQVLSNGMTFGIPNPVVILAIVMILAQLTLSYTVFGRSLLAVGGNREAARLAGIPVRRLTTSAFVICGLAAAIAGIIFASRTGFVTSGQVTSYGYLVLDAIAVVVVGGTSLFGGQGAVWRTAIGVAVFAALTNVFTALAIPPTTANVVKGVVLILAVSLDAYARSRRST